MFLRLTSSMAKEVRQIQYDNEDKKGIGKNGKAALKNKFSAKEKGGKS